MQINADALVVPSADTARAFAAMGARMTDLRGSMADMADGLADLDRVLASQSGNAGLLNAVEEVAAQMLESLARASAAATSDNVTSAARIAEASLDEILTRAKALDSAATLTLVTARSLNDLRFDNYVADLRFQVKAMRDIAGDLAVSVRSLQDRRLRSAGLIASANTSMSRVMTVLATATAERMQAEHLLVKMISEVSALARELPETTEAETGNLVRAMQFSDNLAQRLDHVGTIIRVGNTEAAALVRAQVEALVHETRATTADINSSLGRIGLLARKSAQILAADDGQGPVAIVLNLGRKVLNDLVAEAEDALTAVMGAEAETASLQALAEEATARFAFVTHATDGIHLSAVNAALLARRGRDRENAMNVLSTDVTDQAAACDRAKSACQDAIRMLSLPEDLAAFVAVSPQAAKFRRSVGDTTAAVVAAGVANTELERLRQATVASLSQLADATQVAQDAVSSVLDATSVLSRIVLDLPSALPSDADPLSQVLEIYTMETERIVHRRLFGLPEPEVAQAEPSSLTEDDLLLSIMF